MIYGERIRFRHAEPADVPCFVSWINDPEVRHGIALYLPFSLQEEQHWLEDNSKRPPEERVLCIEARQTGTKSGPESWKLIGSSAFFDIEWRNRSSEFGIMIGEKDYWNRGYGTEAVRLLLRHGFETLNLNRVFLRVFEDNPRAIRAYEKCGFVHEGRQRQAEWRENHYIDVLVMSILREEWQSHQ